jgi:hypothetical protein
MTPGPKMTVDHTVSEEELLRLIGRLEPLHLPFSSSRWPVRVFGAIVEIAADPVPDARQNGALGDAVAAQAVGDQAPRWH